MKYLDLPPDAQKRCDAMWLDSETTIQAVKERFGLGQNDTREIRAKLGDKPNCYSVSGRGLTAALKRRNVGGFAGRFHA